MEQLALSVRAVLAAEKADSGRAQTECSEHVGLGDVAQAWHFDRKHAGRIRKRSSPRFFQRAAALFAAVKEDNQTLAVGTRACGRKQGRDPCI